MAAHFLYKHLPASGLGNRDPLRPYATGGLGGLTYLQYLVTLLDTLLYQATLAGNLLVSLSLTDEAARVAATISSVAAVLYEAETVVVSASEASTTATVDDADATSLVAYDEADSATIREEEATATMVDRATVVTLTDTKVG